MLDTAELARAAADAAAEAAAEAAGRIPGVSRVIDGMHWICVTAGEFRMGSTNAKALSNEEPLTERRISRGFWPGKHELN